MPKNGKEAQQIQTAIRSTGMIQIFLDLTAYRPVSIRRPGLEFLKKSLLNVRYDWKNEGLNILSNRSYNRVMRVLIGGARSACHGTPRFWQIS